jgi:hypothetical protein
MVAPDPARPEDFRECSLISFRLSKENRMGAKTCMLVASNVDTIGVLRSKPKLDEDATHRLVAALFPSDTVVLAGDADLTFTSPPEDQIVAGCFSGVSIVAAKEFGIDRPSKLDARFMKHFGTQHIVLHAMHSVVDWFGFAVWRDGRLVRSLSVAPDHGVIEDIGDKLAFEQPFWSNKHPAVDPEDEDDDYPLPFHPLELGEAALEHFFGFQIEGFMETKHPDPETVRLLRFVRKRAAPRPWWKIW